MDESIQMVAEWLKANNYDGLYVSGECGCLLDDLAPCGEYCSECTPGYKLPDNEGYDFMVGEQPSPATVSDIACHAQISLQRLTDLI